jgi:uncharacterized repeat protein (TIGR03803 family)
LLVLLAATTPLLADISPLTSLHDFGAGDDGGPYSRLIRASDGAWYGTTPMGGANGGGAVFRVTADGDYERIHDFTVDRGGLTPWGGVVQASDGNLYGTTQNGGRFFHGVVYRLSLDGSYAVVHHFDTANGFDQGFPTAALVQASDGNLYGTTNSGIGGGVATIFRMSLDGQFTTLHSLSSFNEGAGPGALVQGNDGYLYGTASSGANAACNGVGCGSLFRMSLGGDFEVLHRFADGADGRSPADGLLVANDGSVIGAAAGGTRGSGLLFRHTNNGYSIAFAFSGADGVSPNGGLVQDAAGRIYGTTYGGGGLDAGTVFRFANGSATTLHAFDFADGYHPRSGGVLDGTGNLYGATFEGGDGNDGVVFRLRNVTPGSAPTLAAVSPGSGRPGASIVLQGSGLAGATGVSFGGTGAAFRVLSPTRIVATVPPTATTGPIVVTTPKGSDASASDFAVVPSQKVLASFEGGSDGDEPSGGLVRASDGHFYGVTSFGGSNACSGLGCGTLFSMTPSGERSIVHVFTGDDGGVPVAVPIEGADGTLYGTTSSGGALGGGTIFRFEPKTGAIAVLHAFDSNPPNDGYSPAGPLYADANGTLFGTTSLGGHYSGELCPSGCGSVFSLATNGTITTFERFTNGSDGAYPASPLTPGADGALYGTTYTAIFRVTPAGTYEVVHVLGPDEGYNPDGFVLADDGLLYGAAFYGADSEIYGTIFSVSTSGELTTRFRFHYGDGSGPSGRLLAASDGRLYGVTAEGGSGNSGTVFRFDPAKGLTTLHAFSGADGAAPSGGLVQGADGRLYGVTGFGGDGDGTVYRIDLQSP